MKKYDNILFSFFILSQAITINGMEQQGLKYLKQQTKKQELNPHFGRLTNVTYLKPVTEKTIYRKDIFEYVTGMTEAIFVQHLKTNNVMPDLPPVTTNLMHNLSHNNPTLQELRNTIKTQFSPQNNGKFSIIHVDVVKHPELRAFVDIGALQAKHPGAVFQTASRTNGLEGAQISYLNNKQKFDATKNGFNSIIGKYAVQGEEAQISAAIKGIYEIYQSSEPLNLFDQLSMDIDARGNITAIDSTKLKDQTIESLSDLIRVSHWKNVPVTTGYANVKFQSEAIKKQQKYDVNVRTKNPDDANIIVSPVHLISQVNVAALDMDTERTSMKSFKSQCTDCADTFAQAALHTAYEATLYCALNENKKRVFLTLPGCGSFKNKLEWIADALEHLKSKDIIKNSGLDITLVALEANNNLDKQAWERIKNVALTSGGTITSNGEVQN